MVSNRCGLYEAISAAFPGTGSAFVLSSLARSLAPRVARCLGSCAVWVIYNQPVSNLPCRPRRKSSWLLLMKRAIRACSSPAERAQFGTIPGTWEGKPAHRDPGRFRGMSPWEKRWPISLVLQSLQPLPRRPGTPDAMVFDRNGHRRSQGR
jgi:hypothetical protein